MGPSVSESRIGGHSLKVLLVHGTWGRGFIRKTPVARWCRPDSYFVGQLLDKLEERLPTVSPAITAVNWCGSNSILRRAEAANDLKNQIQTLAAEGGTILIIGHSHGGNVVLQATSKLCDLSNVYVCTLATPFFRLFESERRLTGARTLLTIISLAACIPAAFVLGVVCLWAVTPMADIFGTALLFGFLFAGVVCGSIGGRLLFRLVINPIPKSRNAYSLAITVTHIVRGNCR
jgi:Alpha/beta hydrolase family